MSDEITTEVYLDEEEGVSFCWVATEPVIKSLDALLEDLHYTKGAGFVWTLKEITLHSEFRPLPGETNIYAVGGENGEDYDNLINAARKAVGLGHSVCLAWWQVLSHLRVSCTAFPKGCACTQLLPPPSWACGGSRVPDVYGSLPAA